MVLIAARGARRDHRVERIAPVRPRAVQVEVAAHVVDVDDVRQRAFARRLDLADAEPHLRRDVRHPERRVDVGLRATGDRASVGEVDDPVLADAQVLAHGELAELDVVLARAREVLQQVAVEMRRQHAQVDLQAAREPDARLRRAFREHRFRAVPCGERGRDALRVVRRAHDVDVADGRLLTAHAAGRREVARVRELAQVRDRLARDRQRGAERGAPRAPLVRQHAAADVLDRLRAQPRHRAESTFVERALEVGQRRDAEPLEQLLCGLHADALHLQHVHQGRRIPRAQLLEVRIGPGPRDRGDAAGDALADAGKRRQPRLLDVGAERRPRSRASPRRARTP